MESYLQLRIRANLPLAASRAEARTRAREAASGLLYFMLIAHFQDWWFNHERFPSGRKAQEVSVPRGLDVLPGSHRNHERRRGLRLGQRWQAISRRIRRRADGVCWPRES